ncbi:phage portal protein (plasmid) [Piscirickettsia salmonis]|uniref:phage portal protein n=1 Tax=Piscirickettsia salmonis TaxID=1238 RepID=UPI0009B99BCA|nr:phage portal protein [Piscirickettsia salmonis]QHS30949.1 phage portal protein [Piscirickettsia salmonis]
MLKTRTYLGLLTPCLALHGSQRQSISRDLLLAHERKKYFVKFNIEGLLRGDTAARASFYNRMFSIGVMSQNDIRELENMNPIEDGGRN